jgi:hypothetical protein
MAHLSTRMDKYARIRLPLHPCLPCCWSVKYGEDIRPPRSVRTELIDTLDMLPYLYTRVLSVQATLRGAPNPG